MSERETTIGLRVVTPSRYASDPRVEIAAKAIAWSELTDLGRAECDWETEFSEDERREYRGKAVVVMEALNVYPLSETTDWRPEPDTVMVSVLTGERLRISDSWNHSAAPHYAEFGCWRADGTYRVRKLCHLRTALSGERRAYLAEWKRWMGKRAKAA